MGYYNLTGGFSLNKSCSYTILLLVLAEPIISKPRLKSLCISEFEHG